MIESLVSIRNGLFRTLVRSEGEGDPLLFLHGAGGLGGWPPFWQTWPAVFASSHPTIPGLGVPRDWNIWMMWSIWPCITLSLSRRWGWSSPTSWVIRLGA